MKYLLTIVASLLIVSACKKVDTPPSREEELRSGRWKHSAMTLKFDPYIGKDTTYNLYDSVPVWPACKKDNFLLFAEGFDATQNRGDLKCDESEPETILFHWYLSNDKKQINLYNADNTFFGMSSITADFIDYSTSKFTIQYVDLQPSHVNNTKKDTFTYTHTFVKF